MSGKTRADRFKPVVIMASLFGSATLGYMAGVRQTNPGAPVPTKTYVLNLGPVHLNLTVGAMGVLVIFLLTMLLATAVIFATIASYRRRQAEAANRQVNKLNTELERRVAERTAQLDTANKELEAFSYSVSHDLRAPLRAIDGFSQAILDEYSETLDKQACQYLGRVRTGIRKMSGLIDDLLNLSRMSRTVLRRESIDLTVLARGVVGELQDGEPSRKVAIEIADGLTAHGDAQLTTIVLVNLLGNAWKYTAKRPEAQIAFGSENQGTEVVFYVRDNGAGFDMAYADKLFAPFQRLHRDSEFEGNGIGLATIQRIVLRHGGRIWVKAAVNEGATFFFTLGAVQ
jgi:light-regulated signal transduction histidine kinase (bacteriophytochrome)